MRFQIEFGNDIKKPTIRLIEKSILNFIHFAEKRQKNRLPNLYKIPEFHLLKNCCISKYKKKKHF